MRITSQQARAAVVAMAAVACLQVGCVTTGLRKAEVGRTATGPMPDASPVLSLDSTQQNRAAAVAHFAAGMALEAHEGAEPAMAEYLQSVALDTQNVQLALHVAQIYLNRRDPTNAVAILENATKENPNSPDAWYGLGIVYRNLDQTDKVIAAGHQALKLDAGHLNSIRLLLEVYTQQSTNSDAAGIIAPALKSKSKDSAYWAGLGDILTAVLRLKPSLSAQIDRGSIRQCYEKALALAPHDLEIQGRMAEAYTDSGDYKRAADAYSELLQARPDNQQILDRLWRTYVRSNQKDKAIATLEELAKRDRLRFELYNSLGDLYEETGKPEMAIANFQQSLVLNPNQLELYIRIALAQMRMKQFADTGTTLLTAKEKFPTKYQIPYLQGLLQSDLKNFTAALALFADAEALAKVDPDTVKPSSAFYFAYGSACERAGDSEKATTFFRKAIELDPNNHNAYNYLGYMWADKGVHLQESLELIQEALRLDPDNGAYLDSLGWVLYRLGRYDEALPYLRHAVETLQKEDRQDDATVLDHLAEVLLKLGKRDEAILALKRAVQADPDNKDVAEKLQKYSADHTATH